MNTVEAGLDEALQTLEVPASATGDGSVAAKLGAFSGISQELGQLRGLPAEMEETRSSLEQRIAELSEARDAALAEASTVAESVGSSEAALAEARAEIEKLSARGEELRAGFADEIANLTAARDAAMAEATSLRPPEMKRLRMSSGSGGGEGDARLAELEQLVAAKEQERTRRSSWQQCARWSRFQGRFMGSQGGRSSRCGRRSQAKIEQLTDRWRPLFRSRLQRRLNCRTFGPSSMRRGSNWNWPEPPLPRREATLQRRPQNWKRLAPQSRRAPVTMLRHSLMRRLQSPG
ncbi:MAG: hypothetical protein R3C97_18185 [Geminicoccaceae bacterium]